MWSYPFSYLIYFFSYHSVRTYCSRRAKCPSSGQETPSHRTLGGSSWPSCLELRIPWNRKDPPILDTQWYISSYNPAFQCAHKSSLLCIFKLYHYGFCLRVDFIFYLRNVLLSQTPFSFYKFRINSIWLFFIHESHLRNLLYSTSKSTRQHQSHISLSKKVPIFSNFFC